LVLPRETMVKGMAARFEQTFSYSKTLVTTN